MGYARHIGRVGALAVTLGVGIAIATTPGTAYADTSGSSTAPGGSSATSPSKSSSTTTSSGTEGSNGADGPDGTEGTDGADASGADAESPSGSTDESGENGGALAGDDTPDGDEDAEEGEEPVGGGAEGDSAPGDEDALPTDPAGEQDDSGQGSGSDGSPGQQGLHGSVGAQVSALSDDTDDVDSADDAAAGQFARTKRQQSQALSLAADVDGTAKNSPSLFSADVRTTSATTFTTAAATTSTPVVPQQGSTLVSVISDLVAAVLNPLLSPGNGSPIQIPILSAMLSMVRDELERFSQPRSTTWASQQTVALLTDPSVQPSAVIDPTKQHVLVIGVDGTNLSRILADDDNVNFFALMDDSTTAASSIVGHTTISNPSWTSILTGVWGERAGVINNVFTPWTYDKYPTVFNQLETQNAAVKTVAIADWDGINAIAGAGSLPVDTNVFVPQIEGDTNWLDTDDAVGAATVAAISGATPPNFVFAYFVGVDENGHMYGGASPEYADAITNVDENLGLIMQEVNAWNAAHPDEQWTVLVTTDHGHQPQLGFGHGFQSPDETSTFVIANGPQFKDGYINTAYEIIDTTPTVMSIFGGTALGSDGVSLTTLGDSDEDPVDLHQALEDEIAQNEYPDIITNVALSLRTIFATVPYYVYMFGNEAGAGLPDVLLLPVKLLIDGLYVATNVPAQIVALATGVTGASIFPLLPPPPPMFPPAEEGTSEDSIMLVCVGASGPAASCGQASVA
jgi:hypothetical protein